MAGTTYNPADFPHRGRCANKLNPGLARVIRLMKARYPDLTTRELGEQFGVSHTAIRLVLSNRSYAESVQQERAS